MNASLSEKLSAVKWGEFRLTDIFVVKKHIESFGI